MATTNKEYKHKLANVVKKYDNYYNQYSAAETAKANQQKAANTATANNNVRQAYVNSQLANKSLNANLARQGITGGASETSMVNANNNLANVQSGYKNNLASTNQNVDNTLSSTLQTYKLENDKNKDTAYQNERNLYRQDKQTALNNKINAQNVREKRYANTISGYTTKRSIDKAIKEAKKHKSTRWKVGYLRAQRATLKV